jgi:hypothetical protein
MQGNRHLKNLQFLLRFIFPFIKINDESGVYMIPVWNSRFDRKTNDQRCSYYGDRFIDILC